MIKLRKSHNVSKILQVKAGVLQAGRMQYLEGDTKGLRLCHHSLRMQIMVREAKIERLLIRLIPDSHHGGL
jgi:hypothetical protein